MVVSMINFISKGGHFEILAIWSHGANNCLDAKTSVAFFTRLDKTFWKYITDRIWNGRCIMKDTNINCLWSQNCAPTPAPWTPFGQLYPWGRRKKRGVEWLRLNTPTNSTKIL